MSEYISKEEFIDTLSNFFDVVVGDSYYDSLSSLGIDRYDFEDFLCKKYGEDKCSCSYDDTMCLSDVYSNLFS